MFTILVTIILSLWVIHGGAQQLDLRKQQIIKPQSVVAEMQVVCLSDSIVLKMNTNTPFNGMVYAREAPSSPSCVTEFNSATNMTYKLPLKSCGTLFSEVDDGIEYFNTIVVQPHMRLMTNQGKGYHVRCKYQTRERTISNTQFNVSAAFQMQDAPKSTTPLLATASMPSCTMKIFRKGRSDIAETVKIGDKLVMVIEIDRQEMYGMRISNCAVRDGMNMAEQVLIDNIGCPLDETIMPAFAYSENYTRAEVSFPAHKFPHTSSVYYQCNISLCINNGNCMPADCKLQATSGVTNKPTDSRVAPSASARRKRHSHNPNHEPSIGNRLMRRESDDTGRLDDVSFEVYSGLMVNDPDMDEDATTNKMNNQKEQQAFSLGQLSAIDYGGFGLSLACLIAFGVLIAVVCQVVSKF